MRRILAVFCLVAFTMTLAAQSSAGAAAKPKQVAPKTPAAPPQAVPEVAKDLPVRKVVLYKNGVGYFEHAGTVSGNQKVAIDFTSPQLNDVLQSLTVLDEGGGRIAGVNYNSTTPVEQQLRTLALGLKDYPATLAVYQALRGQRVEVAGAGAPLTGKLVNIEFRKEMDKNGQTSEDHYFLIVATDSGALRTAELTDSVSVRMLDASLQKQFANYLEIVASAQNQQVRHLVLEDRGEGERQLRVSYISEVPVWKSTYRMVFPQTANGSATVQGWAVVDNTVGADWDNVQLSLVAGAPQSFIQPLSQPLYTHRQEIPIATSAQLTPQTHEAAETAGSGTISGIVTDVTGAVIPGATVTVTALGTNASTTQTTSSVGSYAITGLAPGQYTLTVTARGFKTYRQRNVAVSGQQTATVNVSLNVGAATQTITVEAVAAPMSGLAGIAPGVSAGARGGGGVYRASDAIQEGDVATNAFDDFFQYALTQPVTIHKNESAMVPILQQELPAQHVTLWSQSENRALRALWLENKSKLTLDAGSFSIFESGEFAGEGLLDPIHPGEKRLLSYAADQAVRVHLSGHDSDRKLHHVKIGKGVIIETKMVVASMKYTASNSADVDRVVLLEHVRHGGDWTLDDGLKADETSPNLYRFRLPVAANSTATLDVRERGPEYTQVYLNANSDQTGYLLDLVKRVPDALEKLRPVIDAQTKLADLEQRITESKKTEETAAADETRDRENLTALKGSDAARRFVDELNRAEDLLQATRKQTAELEQQKQTAADQLNELIGGLSFDWSVQEK